MKDLQSCVDVALEKNAKKKKKKKKPGEASWRMKLHQLLFTF